VKYYFLVTAIAVFLASCNVTVCSGDCDPDPGPGPGPDPDMSTAKLTSGSAPVDMLTALTHTGAAAAQRRAVRLSDRQVSSLRQYDGDKAPDNSPWEIWLESSFSDVEDNRHGADISSDIVDVTGGFSYRVNRDLVIGMAGGYEELEAFGYRRNAYVEQTGLLIGPFAGYRLNEYFFADAWAGYRYVDGDSRVTNLDGSYDGDGYFFATSLSAIFSHGSVYIQPKATLFYSDSEIDAYRLKNDTKSLALPDHDQTFGATQISTEINRPFQYSDTLQFTPFVRVGVAYEFDRTIDDSFLSDELENEDPSRWRGGAGLGIHANFSEQAAIEVGGGYEGIGVSDYDIWSLHAAIKISLN